MDSEQQRREYLTSWARHIERAALRGVFGNKRVALQSAQLVNGPRAGAIELEAGLDSGAMLKSLAANGGALLRQFIPFEFAGEPACFMSGRRVRMEAGWPRGLAEDDIPLAALGQHPAGSGRWLVGRTERGNVLTAGLSDMTPHWLFSGTTGSGKTVALRSAIAQFANDADNRLVLIDPAKHGASLADLSGVRGLVGPLAVDIDAARAALAWCVKEMSNRFSGGRDARRLVVAIDEVQDIANDALAAECLRQLVTQGRQAHVHVLAATQHPVVAALGGPVVGRCFGGRLALRVSDYDASRVAVGGKTPRADWLLGCGDSYAVGPGVMHRCQVAYHDPASVLRGEPEMPDWPADSTDIPGARGWPSGEELGAALAVVLSGGGRTRLQDVVHCPDNTRASNLIKLAKSAIEAGGGRGVSVCLECDTHTKSALGRDKGRRARALPDRQTDGGE